MEPYNDIMTEKRAERIQTSILNGIEKRILVWLAEKQPRWVVSDVLTCIGSLGAVLFATGFVLSGQNINWLWLSIVSLAINWYGDSLDGTVARVRKMQRPLYGYYLDHTVDCINEAVMFIGVGLSPLMRLDIALMIFVIYLCLTINVSINAHLKSEFKLTYAKLGPTEFRIIVGLLTSLFIFIPWLKDFRVFVRFLGNDLDLASLDLAGLVIFAALVVIYLVTIIQDARGYAKMDPMPKIKEY